MIYLFLSVLSIPSPCLRHKLHAIVDEVYMLTVFEDTVTFHSVLSMDRYDAHAHKICLLNVHYLSKVWGHLEMSLFLKEKHYFCSLK